MRFSTYKVEIAPVFREFDAPAEIDNPEFRVLLCDTNAGGRYRCAAPVAEFQKIIKYDEIWNGDLEPDPKVFCARKGCVIHRLQMQWGQ